MPRSFLILLIAATALLAYMLRPIVVELIAAAVFASALWPVHCRLTERLGKRRRLSAGLLTLGAILLVIVPVGAMLTFVVRDGASGVRFVSEAARSDEVAALVDRLPEGAQHAVHRAIDRVPQSTDELIADVGGAGDALSSMRKAVTATGSIALQIALMMIALFMFLARGTELIEWVERVSPLGRSRTAELLATFRKVSYSVIVAAGGTAAVQAFSGLIGYWIARVPSPLFFAFLTFVGSLVPAIGGAAVCIGAAVLLLVTGHAYAALFLFVWALLVVGVVDNIVKPLFLRRGLEIPGVIMFFSLIAGIAAFGAIGLLLGPLVVSFFLAVVRMYERDFALRTSDTAG